MRTIRLRYLTQELLQKLTLKSLLLTLSATLLLSACGTKGDLYQAPEQSPVVTTDKNPVKQQEKDFEQKAPTEKAVDESQKQQANEQ